MKIYVDMDGVLCDFLGGVSRLVERNIKTRAEWAAHRDEYWQAIKAQGWSFWRDLEWCPDAKLLWSVVAPHNPIILSAYPMIDDLRGDAIVGKHMWLSQNISRDVSNNAQLCKVYNKQLRSGPGAILIDDNKQTIPQWNKRGGIGILHTDTKSTLKELKKYARIRI